jgi:hypothetical protein
MVWNWGIFDDNLIKVVQALASRSRRPFRLQPVSPNLGLFVELPGTKIFDRLRHAEA